MHPLSNMGTPSSILFFPSLALLLLVGGTLAACTGSDGDSTGAAPDASVPSPPDGAAASDAANVDDGGADAPSTDGAVPSDAAVPTSGCGLAPAYAAGTTSTASVNVDGKPRTFRVHVPPGYTKDKPLPVVIVLHGGGGSGEQIELESSKMNPIADREGFIAVYPNGSGLIKTWNAGFCCGKAAEDDVDDVAFIGALLDDLQAKTCTDERRVFATGMSNGAMLSHRLACEMSDRVAAIAPVAATIAVQSCQPTSKVAVMQIQGTSDGHVPWNGGKGCSPASVDFTSVPATMQGWRTRNGCADATTSYFQQGDGTCVAYQGCASPVVLCSIEGGGHSWPGGEPKPNDGGVIDCPADGHQSTSFIASEAIWTFFKANPKPM